MPYRSGRDPWGIPPASESAASSKGAAGRHPTGWSRAKFSRTHIQPHCAYAPLRAIMSSMAEIQPRPPGSTAVQPVDEVEASRMTLGEHLEELRVRLVKSTIVIALAFIGCWVYRKPLDVFAQGPYQRAATELNAELERRAEAAIQAEGADPEEWREWYEPSGYPQVKQLRSDLRIAARMKGDAAATGFFYYLKLCFYISLFISGPFLLWQMWGFIAAGLYRHERAVVNHYFPASLGLFLAGVLFGYFVLIPNALYFLALQTLESIQWYESVDNYWTFMLALTLALGLVFQLPIVMLGLARLGLVEPRTFARFRPHMIVGALVVGALLTPPDPFTQMMMAGPIVVLYELGHIASRLTVRKPVERKSTP